MSARMRRLRSVHAIVLVGVMHCVAPAQSLNDRARELGVETLVRDFMRPAADAIGNGLNSGLYHTARVRQGFHFWLGLQGIWSIVPEKDLQFVAKLPESMTALGYPATVTTATIFGDKGAVLRSSQLDPSGKPYPDVPLPDGTNVRATFLVVPQLNVGTFFSSELMIRAIPSVTYDSEIGKVRFLGFGLKHSISQTLNLPLDIAAMVAYQDVRIGEILHVRGWSGNVHVSAPFLIFTVLAGIGYDSYNVKASYYYTPPVSDLPDELNEAQQLSLEFERPNIRMTAGLTLTIAVVDVTASYSIGYQHHITFGAGITF